MEFDFGFPTKTTPGGQKDVIKLYTDGASRGNIRGKSICAYAFYLKYKSYERLSGKAYIGFTNNQMEILGLIQGLRWIRKKDMQIEVFLDSKYVYNAITKDWLGIWKRNGWTKKGGLKNANLWKALNHELNNFEHINFNWVKGHANNFGNNLADKECNDLMDHFERENH